MKARHSSVSLSKNSNRLLKSNAMKPLNWFTGTITLFLTPGIINSPEQWITITFAVILITLIIVYIGVYIYFMLMDPDRLQTEQYRLDSAMITLTAKSQEEMRVTDTAGNFQITENGGTRID